MFLSFDIEVPQKDPSEFDEEVFSIGVGKPVVPIFEDTEEDPGLVSFQKSLEERIAELLSQSIKIEDFDLFENYIEQLQKEEAESKVEEVEEQDDALALESIQTVDEEESVQAEETNITNVEEVQEELQTTDIPVEEENADLAVEELDELKKNADLEEEKPKISFDDLLEDDKDIIDSVLPGESIESEDTPLQSTNEEEDESIEWNWGDELKEELGEEDEETPEETEAGEVEEEQEKLLGEEVADEENAFDRISQDLHEDEQDEIEEEEIEKEDEEVLETDSASNLDLTIAEELGKTKEETVQAEKEVVENIEEEVDEPSDNVKKKISFNRFDWKKQGYGKSFWILLGAFVVFTIIGLYYLLFFVFF